MAVVYSNPFTYTIAPTAVVGRVRADDMLVGAPVSGGWVLAVSAYNDEPYVRASFPGQQVASYTPIKAIDRGQQGRYHGNLLATEPITVSMVVTTLDAAGEIVQRREVEVEVDDSGWVPYSLDLNLYGEAVYIKVDLSFTSLTATLYLDSIDIDVETVIPFYSSAPAFSPYYGIVRDEWGAVSEWDQPADGAASSTVVTLEAAQTDDPTLTSPGGPDQYLRIDYDEYLGDNFWALRSSASRPVHEGNLVVVQADIWIPSGMEGVDIYGATFDALGNTAWSHMPMYDGWFSDTAEWVTVCAFGRVPMDGNMSILVMGYGGPAGHLYAKNFYLDVGDPRLLYSSDFGSTIAGWTPSTPRPLSMVMKDGLPTMKVDAAEASSMIGLDEPLPLHRGDRIIFEFDYWRPEGYSGSYHISENVDPVGTNINITGGLGSGVPGSWGHSTVEHEVGSYEGGSVHLLRDTKIGVGVPANSEAFLANVQVSMVRPHEEHRIGFNPDWQTTRFINTDTVTPRLPHGAPGDQIIAFALTSHGLSVPAGYTQVAEASDSIDGPLRYLEAFTKVRGGFEVPIEIPASAVSHGIIIVGNFPAGMGTDLILDAAISDNPAAMISGSAQGLAVGAIWIRGSDDFEVTPSSERLDLFSRYDDHMRTGTWPGATTIDRIGLVIYNTPLGGDASFDVVAQNANVIQHAFLLGTTPQS